MKMKMDVVYGKQNVYLNKGVYLIGLCHKHVLYVSSIVLKSAFSDGSQGPFLFVVDFFFSNVVFF